MNSSPISKIVILVQIETFRDDKIDQNVKMKFALGRTENI